MNRSENVLGIRALVRELITQIYRRAVVFIYQNVPVLLRVYRPVINRDRYLLRLSPTRFAIQLYRHPSISRDDERFLANYLKLGMTYVDVGANIGTTTLAAAHAVGATGTVIAFEAHPGTFRDLSANVKLNPDLAAQITVVASAVGDVPGKAAISDLPENDVNHIDNCGIVVPMTTLDEALDSLSHIDLLKVDVEGYEKNVFAGATRTLSKTDAVYFESCESNFAQFGYSVDDLFDLLSAQGFSCYAVQLDDINFTKVGHGRHCTQGYENLFACRGTPGRLSDDTPHHPVTASAISEARRTAVLR